jgi:hypothetical protein
MYLVEVDGISKVLRAFRDFFLSFLCLENWDTWTPHVIPKCGVCLISFITRNVFFEEFEHVIRLLISRSFYVFATVLTPLIAADTQWHW